ncbi:TBC1 domain family member 20 [Sciurus carolinensis]|uniref:TBC1 domain family member 20 n=1 Tax=Sciurus carolinensis TaxID=30640 RepID=A0AA41MK63_SCICA|nr:TBC1 domain family member 20 [Sciurus carolinensis]
MVEKSSNLHLRDFMDPIMDNTRLILNYTVPIIDQVSPELHDYMQSAKVGTIFVLSWLIAWFGDVLADFRHIAWLYDCFLACHPLMPIYFAAVFRLYDEQEVLASVHPLSQIPEDLHYETLMGRAGDLFVQFPSSELAWEAAAPQQRLNMALWQRFQGHLGPETRTKDVLTKPRTSRFVKLAVMGLLVALGAAALVVVKSALERALKF